MDAFLAKCAADAYKVEPALVMRALTIADPFPLPAEFLKSCKWVRTDAHTPEHNAYLVARWIATLNAQGLSANAVLDEMATHADVPYKRPFFYRVRKWLARTP